ncbi:carbohydrate ABC transporter permease [[Mycoplasma] gypis]|uniref:Sugar ABC transporter permease n=1 Tax=[Mycoplasma] gypis TaxID=92404 RepID=A0ABZ2RR89_9BACT|nr:sugar ABC transporter permease [[Mycoplasma] gypis]MBN0919033.1 sugar ABC transporter permease [[Mycoplasma] gypis]
MTNFFKNLFLKKFRIKKSIQGLSILNRNEKFYKPLLLILPSLLTILLFTLIPFIITISNAFTKQVGFHAWETVPSLQNFPDIFSNPWFLVGIRNSIVYSLTSLPISLCISIIISSAIAHVIRKWARGFWQTIFFLPYVTSAIAVSVTFFYIFDTNAGIVNSIFGVKIPWLTSGSDSSWYPFVAILVNGVWGNLAFQILILTSAMLSVSPMLYKSASIDGSYKFKQFFAITLPSIRKTISFLITIGIIGGIKTFPLALFNNQPVEAFSNGGSTIMLYIYYMVQSAQFYKAGAASLVLFVLGVIISFGLRKVVSISYDLSTKLGVRRVTNKIKNQTSFSKKIFKI